MKFGLYEGNMKVMHILASSEKEAWKKIKGAGIRNKSKMFTLIKEE